MRAGWPLPVSHPPAGASHPRAAEATAPDITAGTEPSLRPASLLLEPAASLPGSWVEGAAEGPLRQLQGGESPEEKKQAPVGHDSPLSTTSQTSTFTMSSVAETGENSRISTQSRPAASKSGLQAVQTPQPPGHCPQGSCTGLLPGRRGAIWTCAQVTGPWVLKVPLGQACAQPVPCAPGCCGRA